MTYISTGHRIAASLRSAMFRSSAPQNHLRENSFLVQSGWRLCFLVSDFVSALAPVAAAVAWKASRACFSCCLCQNPTSPRTVYTM
eukprot:3525132-Rhodomonas_salina.1